MSARNFFRRASKRVHEFWNSLKCTHTANCTVEDFRESPEYPNYVENAEDTVSVPVYQSASFSANRFAQMPLLPGEVSTHYIRCQSVMMGSVQGEERPVVSINRLVTSQRRVRPGAARYGFSRRNIERHFHNAEDTEDNATPRGEDAGTVGDSAVTNEVEEDATVANVRDGGGDVWVVEDVN